MGELAPQRAPLLPRAVVGQHDYVVVALMLLAVVGLALLPTHRANEPRSDANGASIASRRVVQQSGAALAQEEGDEREHSEPLVIGASGKQPAVARSHALACSGLVFVTNFTLWIVLAVAFNAFSKSYLRDSRNPIGLVVLQGVTGVTVLCALGGVGVFDLRSSTKLSEPAARGVGLAALCHTSQALFTNFAVFVGGVAVTNALKAMEPVAAAVFSYFLLGKRITAPRGAALAVIIGGILTLTYKGRGGGGGDASNRILISAAFTLGAVSSNAMRNVIIKRGDPIPPHLTLLACSAVATVVGLSLMLLRLVGQSMDDLLGQGCGADTRTAVAVDGLSWVSIGGVKAAICYVGLQLASFNLLAFLSPLGHAVGNSCKRVIVFASGILLLGEVMSARQLGGTAVALIGVMAYGLAGTLGDGPARAPCSAASGPSAERENRFSIGWCLRLFGVRRLVSSLPSVVR